MDVGEQRSRCGLSQAPSAHVKLVLHFHLGLCFPFPTSTFSKRALPPLRLPVILVLPIVSPLLVISIYDPASDDVCNSCSRLCWVQQAAVDLVGKYILADKGGVGGVRGEGGAMLLDTYYGALMDRLVSLSPFFFCIVVPYPVCTR